MNDNRASHAGEPASIPIRYRTNAAHRILVVDDDISILQFATKMLVQSGYHVDTAEDGAAAWDVLQINSYDLLVTDNKMPKVSGVELLKKLCAARMNLPTILMSGAMPTEELNRHPGLQIEATLLKPYTVPELLGTVKEVLRATDDAREPVAPPGRQSQPPLLGLQL
jgi:two-component system alkaline phosphatase synthesis response regulator PhoP